jgi:hypothetical protein
VVHRLTTDRNQICPELFSFCLYNILSTNGNLCAVDIEKTNDKILNALSRSNGDSLVLENANPRRQVTTQVVSAPALVTFVVHLSWKC